MFQENSIETCMLSRVKQITSPGWMHETSVRTWCTWKTQRNRVEIEVGGGIGMGNTCKPMADSCQCMTKTKTNNKKNPITLTRRTFVGKIMSLLFNMLSRLVIAFLPRSKFFTSWLQSPSAVTLEPKKIKSVTVSIVSPSICHEVMGPDAMILVF